MQRRHFLALSGTVSLAGCTGMPQDAVVKADQQSATAGTIDIAFRDLPGPEQRIVEIAVEEEFYHACPELPEAVRSLANRIESERPYLEYHGESYGLWISITDQVYAMTASPPENSPSCGIF
ncbi:hypothetical protein G9C85_07340 [Halorubellus sp. JP-L1]|uniref:hypothetical protein n=1 Tax=Halorubellus sp. JP-L1 TaxID=2715753 RepID=UPI001409BCE7|nr:hypothetical protein [Halorubellus sp. JP-L1]NHN41451.1 hypothetical protein [Halorubellus sp. JP-L1]